ncbi:MAG: serine hydrolase [Rudanella sp.]|nr:serine hydrolase [Rudanella sp.]
MYWFLSLLLLFSFITPAQAQNRFALDSLANKARQYLNARQPDSLYAMMGDAFHKEIPADQFRTITAGLSGQLGNWKLNTFRGFKGSAIRYKATFANAPMDFYLSQDSSGRIQTFLFRNYEPDPPTSLPTVVNTNPLRTRFDQQVDSLTRTFFARNKAVGLSIGLLRNDSLFVFGYGETAKGNKTPPTAENLFEIGSISKTFTATLLADLVERGKLKLTDPVNRYLPDSIPALQKDGKPVTLLTLSNHTSGLPRLPTNLNLFASPINPYKTYDRAALFSFLKWAELATPPGQTLAYSNLGVGLLGTVLELKTGQSYQTMLTNRITGPLKMNHTFLTISDIQKPLFVQGHDSERNPASSWEFQSLAGAGAIRSTVNDLMLYLKAQMGAAPKSLTKAIRLTHQPTFSETSRQIGLGWFTDKQGWFYHHGGTGGFTSFAGFSPDNQMAIVVLSNASARVDTLSQQLIELVHKK